VDRKDVIIRVGSGNAIEINRHSPARPTFGGRTGAGMIDKDPSHCLGSSGKEVPPAVELLVSNQSQVCLMNKGSGVKSVARGFRGHARGGELA